MAGRQVLAALGSLWVDALRPFPAAAEGSRCSALAVLGGPRSSAHGTLPTLLPVGQIYANNRKQLLFPCTAPNSCSRTSCCADTGKGPCWWVQVSPFPSLFTTGEQHRVFPAWASFSVAEIYWWPLSKTSSSINLSSPHLGSVIIQVHFFFPPFKLVFSFLVCGRLPSLREGGRAAR